MNKLMPIVLLFASLIAGASDLWPPVAKASYVDRCSESMARQGLPASKARAYCACLADSMEAEFGMKEYDQMMKAEANPGGGEHDRRLYRVLTACSNHLPR